MARKPKYVLKNVKFKVRIDNLEDNQIVLHTGEELDEVVTIESTVFPSVESFDTLKLIIRSILDKKAQQEKTNGIFTFIFKGYRGVQDTLYDNLVLGVQHNYSFSLDSFLTMTFTHYPEDFNAEGAFIYGRNYQQPK